jgi:uncharacterized phiE125 gp8 family phage protein
MSHPAQIEAPAVEPVDVEDVKAHLRIEHALDDDLLELYIKSAREQAEARMQRSIITTTLEAVFPRFSSAMALRLPTVTEIVSVKYLDTSGVEQTLAPSEYILRARRAPALLMPAHGKCFPETIGDPEAVKVRYKAGYGEDADAVPQDIKQWIMLTVGQMYETREAATSGSLQVVPAPFYMGLLDRHCVVEV